MLPALVAGCATPPSDPTERAAFERNKDPLEPLNRRIFDVNLFIDRILLKPVAKVYVAVLPEPARDAVKRGLDNMKEPVVFINNVLQGEPERAGITVGRFVVNSTLGLGGLFDVAGQWGLEKQVGDFGQTLYAWGLPEGPYLMAPLLGPSNPRDLTGMGIDAYMDPFSFLATAENLDPMQITRFVVDGVDQRARNLDTLDDLQANSLDFYAQLRSLSQQRRAAELQHNSAPEPVGDLYKDPGQSPAPPTGPQPTRRQPVNPQPVKLQPTPPQGAAGLARVAAGNANAGRTHIATGTPTPRPALPLALSGFADAPVSLTLPAAAVWSARP
ncbi:MAG TPA: VacJ family lipoprotein [Stellaceae bacterium]|nr:VacJ family lipoprotein [Stellaceae bacterium]